MPTIALIQTPNSWHQASLIGLATILAAALYFIQRQVRRSSPPKKSMSYPSLTVDFKHLALGILLWQLGMAVLATAGYFRAFEQPLRALPTVGLSLITTIYLVTRAQTLTWLLATPAWAWLAIQSFRFPLELLLYSMYLHGIIGSQMTFAGLNADILAGGTAPLAAWLLWRYQNKLWTAKFSLFWNALGLLLLMNILVIAVLSVPFPFQYFKQEPANRMVAEFPFVWLPTLFIPLALFAHLASIRLAWRKLYQSATV